MRRKFFGKLSLTTLVTMLLSVVFSLSVFAADVPITAITIKGDKEIKAGLTANNQMDAVEETYTATIKGTGDVTWISSDPSVLKIIDAKTTREKATVETVSYGTATIIAMAQDKTGKIATYTVKVTPLAPAAKVVIEGQPLDAKGKVLTKIDWNKTDSLIYNLRANVLDSKNKPATSQDVEWTTSNENVAEVIDGSVKVVGFGDVTITAKTTDGSKKAATWKFKVTPEVPATNVAITVKDGETVVEPVRNVVTVQLADAVKLNYNLSAVVNNIVKGETKPATNQDVIWSLKAPKGSSSSITADGVLTLDPYAVGKVDVTATTTDGTKKTAKVTFDVKKAAAMPTKVEITPATTAEAPLVIGVGADAQLTATVTEGYDKNLTWKSSDAKTVTVDENGLITGVKANNKTIKITATSKANTKVKAEAYIKVSADAVAVTEEKVAHTDNATTGNVLTANNGVYSGVTEAQSKDILITMKSAQIDTTVETKARIILTDANGVEWDNGYEDLLANSSELLALKAGTYVRHFRDYKIGIFEASDTLLPGRYTAELILTVNGWQEDLLAYQTFKIDVTQSADGARAELAKITPNTNIELPYGATLPTDKVTALAAINTIVSEGYTVTGYNENWTAPGTYTTEKIAVTNNNDPTDIAFIYSHTEESLDLVFSFTFTAAPEDPAAGAKEEMAKITADGIRILPVGTADNAVAIKKAILANAQKLVLAPYVVEFAKDENGVDKWAYVADTKTATATFTVKHPFVLLNTATNADAISLVVIIKQELGAANITWVAPEEMDQSANTIAFGHADGWNKTAPTFTAKTGVYKFPKTAITNDMMAVSGRTYVDGNTTYVGYSQFVTIPKDLNVKTVMTYKGDAVGVTGVIDTTAKTYDGEAFRFAEDEDNIYIRQDFFMAKTNGMGILELIDQSGMRRYEFLDADEVVVATSIDYKTDISALTFPDTVATAVAKEFGFADNATIETVPAVPYAPAYTKENAAKACAQIMNDTLKEENVPATITFAPISVTPIVEGKFNLVTKVTIKPTKGTAQTFNNVTFKLDIDAQRDYVVKNAEELKAALASPSVENIKLGADIATEPFTIAKSITIDGAGKKITTTDGVGYGAGNVDKTAILVSSGEVTIKNLKVNVSIDNANGSVNGISVNKDADATITGCTEIKATNTNVTKKQAFGIYSAEPTVKITNNKVTAERGIGVEMITDTAKPTITGNTVTGTAWSFFICGTEAIKTDAFGTINGGYTALNEATSAFMSGIISQTNNGKVALASGENLLEQYVVKNKKVIENKFYKDGNWKVIPVATTGNFKADEVVIGTKNTKVPTWLKDKDYRNHGEFGVSDEGSLVANITGVPGLTGNFCEKLGATYNASTGAITYTGTYLNPPTDLEIKPVANMEVFFKAPANTATAKLIGSDGSVLHTYSGFDKKASAMHFVNDDGIIFIKVGITLNDTYASPSVKFYDAEGGLLAEKDFKVTAKATKVEDTKSAVSIPEEGLVFDKSAPGTLKDVKVTYTLGTGRDVATAIDKVTLSGEVVAKTNYTITASTKTLAFKASFLKTLAVGTQTFSVHFNDATKTAVDVAIAINTVTDDKALDEAKTAKVATVNALKDDLSETGFTTASWTAFTNAITADIAAINAKTTIAEVNDYTLTATISVLVTKASEDDTLVSAKKGDGTFLGTTYATKAAAETAIKALATNGTFDDNAITWVGLVATVALNDGTEITFTFTDITALKDIALTSVTVDSATVSLNAVDKTGTVTLSSVTDLTTLTTESFAIVCNNANATAVITNTDGGVGAAWSIEVTAEDGITTATYTITVTAA